MSRTRSSAFSASQSAPSSSSMRDPSERRSTSHKGRRAKELTCESCGKHPVCLQKHRWEHNPLWRDTAQLLLSKHQQVQVMEAAAMLLHGAALPPDRALWPSYMSGGTLPSPGGNPAARDPARAASPSATVSSSVPPTSQFDDDELEQVSEEEIEEDEEEDDEEEITDESDSAAAIATAIPESAYGRARSQSVGLVAPVQSHMPNLVGSYGVGSRLLPSSLAMPAYGWGVISESGQHGGLYGPKSPISESHASPRSPVAIHQHPHLHQGQHQHQHHRSISSYSSFTHSFGSSSTSSYIPSSSLRSSSDLNAQDEDEDEEMRESMQNIEMNDEDEDAFDYNFERATTLCRRLTAVKANAGDSNAAANSQHDGSVKSSSPDRRREEDMYELDMDMD